MGNRMSSLPVARWCGQASTLSAISSRVAALQGSAFHAWCAAPDAPETKALLDRLDEDARAEVMGWEKPSPFKWAGVELRYEDAHHEIEWGLDADGEYVPADSPDCISVGHGDLCWILRPQGIVIVVDIKKGEFTTADGPDSLQLKSYALAAAGKFKCDHAVTGIWSATDGRYWWSEQAIDLWFGAAQIRAEVVAAALNVGGPHVVGSHCRQCYGREHCPAWHMPPELIETSLAPLVYSENPPDESQLLELLVKVHRAEDTVKKAKELLAERAKRIGGILDPVAKKRWAPVEMPGRVSIDRAALAKAGINLADYERRGRPYDQMRWVKA